MKHINTYYAYSILLENEDTKSAEKEDSVDKSRIPVNKQIQALAKMLYKTYIDAGQFKYKMKDKIKQMRTNGASDEDIEEVTEMGDDQLAKLEMSVDEIEQRMIAMAGDNVKLAQQAEIWAGEAKNLAAKVNQEYMEKRATRLERESEDKKDEKVSGDKD
jgi:hypothetical protein